MLLHKHLMHSKWALFNASKYNQISARQLWKMVQEWEDSMNYFPDLAPNQLPEIKFIIGILPALRNNEMRELIKNERINRSLTNNPEKDQMIQLTSCIREDVMKIILQKSIVLILCLFLL